MEPSLWMNCELSTTTLVATLIQDCLQKSNKIPVMTQSMQTTLPIDFSSSVYQQCTHVENWAQLISTTCKTSSYSVCQCGSIHATTKFITDMPPQTSKMTKELWTRLKHGKQPQELLVGPGYIVVFHPR